MACDIDEMLGSVLPGIGAPNPARMGVQTNDFNATRVDRFDHRIEFLWTDSKLRLGTRSANVRMVPTTTAWINSQQNRTALEGLRPVLQGVQRVNRNPGVLFECILIIFPPRKIWREEKCARHSGHRTENVFNSPTDTHSNPMPCPFKRFRMPAWSLAFTA